MTDLSFLHAMHSRYNTPPERVSDLVKRVTGTEGEAPQRIVNGYDNEVYRVATGGDQAVYVRIRRNGEGNFDDEARAMERARGAGVPVPEVVALDRISSDDAERDAMVVTAAPGRAFEAIADELSAEVRREVLTDLGRVLERLHEIVMPGAWRPDDAGQWPEPDELQRYFIADRLAERASLERAGLSRAEIDRTYRFLQEPLEPELATRVLCHGDLNPGHVFVDSRRRISCLIDWGMWHAGSPVGELAYVWKTFGDDGLDAVLDGHHYGSMSDPVLRRAVALSLSQQQIGHIAHHVGIGDGQGVERNVAFLRRALDALA